MYKVLFVCHGNICRSPMAESVMSYLVKNRGLEREIAVSSAAAHTDELGNPPHRGTVKKLAEEGIDLVPHRARLMTRTDGEAFDLLIGMDAENLRDMARIVGGKNAYKVRSLLSFCGLTREVADPWYTGDFDKTYEDILLGCNAIIEDILKKIKR